MKHIDIIDYDMTSLIDLQNLSIDSQKKKICQLIRLFFSVNKLIISVPELRACNENKKCFRFGSLTKRGYFQASINMTPDFASIFFKNP